MTIARNLIWSSVARTLFALVSTAVAFFMMPFLVHQLGERWYGVWVLLAGIAGNYYLLDFGLAAAVTRFVAKCLAVDDDDGVNSVVNTSLCIYSVLGFVIVLLTAAIAWMIPSFVPAGSEVRVIRVALIIVGTELAAEFPFKAFAGILGSRVRYDLLIYSRAIHLVLSTTLIVVLVRHGAGIVGMAATSFFCSQLSNVYYVIVARHLFPGFELRRRHVNGGVAKDLFAYSSWAFASQIANQMRFKIDSLVIASQLSAVAVTYYAVGQRLVDSFVELVYRATNMMTPVFTQYWVQGRYQETREKLLLLTRINVILAMFGGGVILTVGRAFILRWMGESFAVSYTVLVVLMVAMVTELIGCYADNLFYAIAKHQYLAGINVIEGILNLGLSVLFVRSFGIVGAALGTAIPLLVFRLGIIPVLISRFIELPVRSYYVNLLPTALYTGLYLAIYYALAQRFLLAPTYPSVLTAGVVAIPLYAVTIPFVAFSRQERRYLLGLIPFGRAAVKNV